jgi:hypothetical protein
MEHGTADILGGVGRIVASQQPSPLKFDPALFWEVVPGPVLFSRVPGRPDEATDIKNAWQTVSLLAIAGPADRLTHPARALLHARAGEVVLKSATEGDSTRADEILKKAEKTWAKVATLQSNGKVRVGVKAVREALGTLELEESAPAADNTLHHD